MSVSKRPRVRHQRRLVSPVSRSATEPRRTDSATRDLHVGQIGVLREALLDGRTSQKLRQDAVLQLQRSSGNAQVARFLVQRDPEDDNKKRFDEIKKILEAIPTGKEALSLMEKYKVSVKFIAGGGSYYSASNNSMVIDSNHAAARAALAFVHEMNHARYRHEGLTADIKSLGRQEYIRKMVEEETEGVVKSIEGKIELEGTTIDVSKTSYPLEKEYREAYKKAVDAAKAKNPELSAEELKKLGRKAGKERVIKGFMDGEVRTSNTKESYPDYYGKAWDRAHGK